MLIKSKKNILIIFLALFLVGCVSTSGKIAEVMEARREVSSVGAEPSKITVMLPLSGKYASNAKAVRNGFLAAYYQDRRTRSDIKINIVDTTAGNMVVLYQQAVQNGAEVIVGPLTKHDVEELISLGSLPVPTIALNTLDNYTRNFASNLYQFGLLPQDESSQVADEMIKEQHALAAVMVPDNPWGDKLAQVFQGRYEGLGGGVVAILRYKKDATLSAQLCHFLAEDPDDLCGPRKRKDKLVQEVDEEAEAEEKTRRKDIDSIFVVADAESARQIVPLLKFYYAGDLPTYSISTIYSGVSVPNNDRDLNRVYFCDMPWILQDSDYWRTDLPAIKEQIKKLWPSSFTNHPRLYALGIDAYNLSSKLNAFLNVPYQHGIAGATGKLYLDNFNHIYRELDWVKVVRGVPVVLK